MKIMHRRSIPLLSVILVLLFAISSVCSVSAADDIETRITKIEAAVSELRYRVSDNSADIAAINADIQDIEAAIAALEAKASDSNTDLDDRIAGLRAELTNTLKSYVDQKIDTLTRIVNSNSADIAAMKVDIQDIEAAIAAINANMSKYATADQITTAVAALRTELTTTLKAYVDQKIDALTKEVNHHSADIAAMKVDIQDIEAAIAAINANMSQYATASKVTAEITALRTDLTTTLKAYIDQKIDDLTVQVNYNSADIAAVKAEIDSIEIALAALNTNLSKYATIQKVNDELAALRADLIAVLQSYVDQKIDALTVKVNSNTASIDAINACVKELEAAVAILEDNLSKYATKEEMTTALTALQVDVTAALKSYVDKKIKDLYQNSTGDLDIAVIVYRIDSAEEAIALLESNLSNYATTDAMNAEIAAMKSQLQDYIDQQFAALNAQINVNEQKLQELAGQISANEQKLQELAGREDDGAATLAIVGIIIGSIGIVAAAAIGVFLFLNKAKAKP